MRLRSTWLKRLMALISFLIIITLIFSNFTIMYSGNDSGPIMAHNFLSGTASSEHHSEAIEDDSSTIEPYRTRGESRPRMNDVTYAIITPSKFADTLAPLAAWKTQKGVPAEIYNLSWITNNYEGRDKAEKIHNFLIDLNWQTPQLTWLLLVGDADLIPPRYIITNISEDAVVTDMDNFAPTDYYYAGLESNWDDDNDGIYGEEGEEDWTANVYVGRLPVNNITEVNISVNKILDYELSPPIGDWSKTGIFCSALMDVPNIIDDDETDIDEGYNWYKDNAYEATTKILKYLPLGYEVTELTDYTEVYGGNYDRSTDTLNYTSAPTKFNEGAGIVSFISHGYTNGDGVTHYSGTGNTRSFTGYFNHDDAFYAQNGDKLPFIYSSSCSSGDFTEKDDTNFERFITSPTGGAIGVIAATAFTYRGEFNEDDTSWGNWWLAENFWKNFFNGYPQPGENLYNLKEAYRQRILDEENPHTSDAYFKMYRINQLAYNLLDDPELAIHSDVVSEMAVSHPTDIEVITRDIELDFVVNSKDTGKPLKNALICLYGNGIYETIRTDKNGKAALKLHLLEPGTFNITITAQNSLPYESSITIRNKIDLAVNEATLNFSKLNPAAGEDLVFTAEIQNLGQQSAESVVVKFFDGYPETNLSLFNQIGNNKTIEVIEPGEAVNVTLNWVMPTGAHAVYVVADHEDLILESDESNNFGYKVIIENIPPKFSNLPDISIDEDTIIYNVLNLSTYAWDPDTTELEYTISSNQNLNCNVSINSNDSIDIVPELNWHGKTTVTVQVYDGASAAVDSIVIYVSPVNDPPDVEALMYLNATEDEQFKFQIEASDIDSESLVYTDNTELFEIDYTLGLISFITSNEDVGIHNITITINDGEANATSTVILTIINLNDAPELNLTTTTWEAKVDKEFKFEVTATDIDFGDTLVFSDDSDLFEIDPDTGEIAFKPGQKDAGEHRIKISVSDGNITVDQEIILSIEDKSMDSGYELIIVGAIAAIVGVIVGLVLYNRRRRNDQE